MYCLLAPGEAFAQLGCANTLVASANGDGIGGTGLSGDDGIGGTGFGGDDGIGGTGFGDDDGIGGTGFGDDDGIGGTGVYGTITGLGSICVNGLHISYKRDVSVMIFGEPSRASRLGIGHVVWVVAEGPQLDPEEEWGARSITAYNVRVGRVDSIGSSGFSVDGETIVRLDAAWLFAQPGEPGFEIGDWVAVSGLRRPDGRLVASRVDRARPHQRATPINLPWLLRDSTLSRFSIEGYLGTSVLADVEIDAAADHRVETGARVWVESVIEADMIRPTGIVKREYPGDVVIELDFDLRSGGDAKTDSTTRVDTVLPGAEADPTTPDAPSSPRSLREIWSDPKFRAMPDARSPSAPGIPIGPGRTPSIDSPIDIPIEIPIDRLLTPPIGIPIDPGRLGVD
jgi:hypothetical protein